MTTKTISVKVDSGDSKKTIDTLDSAMRNLGKGTKLTADEIAQLTKVAKGVKAGLGDVAASAGLANKNLGGLGRNAGQASIQVQQLVGQVQGGVNPMIALSQQAADLGIVLGAPLIGSVVGIAAAIGASLVPSLFAAKEEIEEILPPIDRLIDKMQELTTAQKDFVRSEVAKTILEQQKRLTETENRINSLISANRNLLRNERENANQIDQNTESLRKLRAERDELTSSIKKQEESIKTLNNAEQELLSSGFNAENGSLSRIQKLAELNNVVDRQIQTIGFSKEQLALYTVSLLEVGEAEKAIGAKIREKISAYYQEIEARQALNAEIEEYARYGQKIIDIAEREKAAALGFANSIIDRAKSDDERFAAQIERLESYRAQGLINQQTYDAAIVASVTARADQIEAQNQRIAKIESGTKEMLISGAVAAFNLTKNQNQKMTKEQKKQAKQSVYINTAAAIARAYGENNFYVASAMALFLAGMQLKQINAIETASGSSGGGGAAPTPAAQPAQNTQQSVQVEFLGLSSLADSLENSNELYSGASMAKLVRSLNEAARNGLNTNTGG